MWLNVALYLLISLLFIYVWNYINKTFLPSKLRMVLSWWICLIKLVFSSNSYLSTSIFPFTIPCNKDKKEFKILDKRMKIFVNIIIFSRKKILLGGNKSRAFSKGLKLRIRKFIELCLCVHLNNHEYDFIIRLLLSFVNLKLKFMM